MVIYISDEHITGKLTFTLRIEVIHSFRALVTPYRGVRGITAQKTTVHIFMALKT
jgi:hypothetical protein